MMIEDNLWQLMMRDDDRWWLYSLIKRLLVMEQMDRWIDGETDNTSCYVAIATKNGLRLWERGLSPSTGWFSKGVQNIRYFLTVLSRMVGDIQLMNCISEILSNYKFNQNMVPI